jgi:hypothetical protein
MMQFDRTGADDGDDHDPRGRRLELRISLAAERGGPISGD